MLSPGSPPFEALVNWLASRQTSELGEEDEDEEEGEADEGEERIQGENQPNDDTESHRPILEEDILALPLLASIGDESIPCAGFNGRCNKVADTCYSFWNGATLMVSIKVCVFPLKYQLTYLISFRCLTDHR